MGRGTISYRDFGAGVPKGYLYWQNVSGHNDPLVEALLGQGYDVCLINDHHGDRWYSMYLPDDARRVAHTICQCLEV